MTQKRDASVQKESKDGILRVQSARGRDWRRIRSARQAVRWAGMVQVARPPVRRQTLTTAGLPACLRLTVKMLRTGSRLFLADAQCCSFWPEPRDQHRFRPSVPDWPTSLRLEHVHVSALEMGRRDLSDEHGHRLIASGVGFLTIILTVWLWLAESRRWIRWLGARRAGQPVIIQGVLAD